jgi:hypothetical protein
MKKYRTKSGTVEEKLPGVNATVNPSEKTQIAMAGGANTLKDVQTILGQEGKRNNLKGQGAKHLVSFDYESEAYGVGPSGFSYGDDDISYSQAFGLDAPKGYTTAPAADPMGGGESGMPTILTDKPFDPDLYSVERAPEARHTAKPSKVSKGAVQVQDPDPDKVEEYEVDRRAKEGPAKSPFSKAPSPASKPESKLDPIMTAKVQQQQQLTKEEFDKAYPIQEFIMTPRSIDRLGKLQEERGFIVPETEEQIEEAKPSIAQKAMDDLARNPGLYIAGTILSKTVPGLQLAPVGTLLSAAFGKGPGVAGHNNPPGPYSGTQATSPVTTPAPDYGPEGGAPDAPKKKLIRSAANNTTLAIAEEGDLTRDQIRRARRQITRFA